MSLPAPLSIRQEQPAYTRDASSYDSRTSAFDHFRRRLGMGIGQVLQ